VVSCPPGLRHFGFLVHRSVSDAAHGADETAISADDVAGKLSPGGSSINGMNLSGNPGIVQPMQMPPTLGHPPMPRIQPRLVTLQSTTGPQQPNFTEALGRSIVGSKSRPVRSKSRDRNFVYRLAKKPCRPQLFCPTESSGPARLPGKGGTEQFP